jgi:hypothetical protein
VLLLALIFFEMILFKASWANTAIFICLFAFFSCQKDPYGGTTYVSFTTDQATYNESDGTIKIGIKFDRQRNVNTELHLTWTTPDTTTFIGGDFLFGGDLVVKPFNTSAYFSLTIEDDTQIDGDDIIVLKLADPTGQDVRINSQASQTTIKIVDNDKVATDRLQADLTWHRSNPQDDINGINFDLYLQTDVQFSNGSITSVGNTYAKSDQLNGFETVNIKTTDGDQTYFLAAFFSIALKDENAVFDLTLNGLGYNSKSYSYKLDPTQVGAAVFFGPFVKSGTSLIGGRQNTLVPNQYYVSQQMLEGKFGH